MLFTTIRYSIPLTVYYTTVYTEYYTAHSVYYTTLQVTPISDYYIIAGVIYQAPDIGKSFSKRKLCTGIFT